MTSSAAVCEALKKFSEKMYIEVLETQNGHYANAFLSPVSIYAAMSLVLAGSQNQTKHEMLAALQLQTNLADDQLHHAIGHVMTDYFKSTPGVTVSMANRLFAQQNANIKADYKNCLSKNYQAESESVNFAGDSEGARKRINQWVSEKTMQKIKELFAPGTIRPDTCVAITNALYFKGLWEHAFQKHNTYDEEFHCLDGRTKSIKMMTHNRDFEATTFPDLDASAVRLPFRHSKWEMLLLVPHKKDGLKTLLPKLQQAGELEKVFSATYDEQKVTLAVPRFKLSENEGVDAKQLLMKLGMHAVFNPGSANLNGICDAPPLFVSEVKHKAILEVDEEGATAAAATGAAVAFCCMMPCLEIRADRPFFVALMYDKTTPVFIGHVTDPEAH